MIPFVYTRPSLYLHIFVNIIVFIKNEWQMETKPPIIRGFRYTILM